MESSKYNDVKIIRRLLQESREYWSLLGLSYLFALLRTPLVLLAPVPLMLVVDSVLSTKPVPQWLAIVIPDSIEQSTEALLILAVFLVVLFAFLTQLHGQAIGLFKMYIGEKLTLSYRARLLRHAQRLSLAYHDEKGTADTVYRIQNDANSLSNVVVYGLMPMVTASLTLSSLLYVTAQLDWKLALIALSISPILIIASNFFRKLLRDQWRKVKEVESAAQQVVQETLGTLRVVKAFGQEDRENSRFLDTSSKGVDTRLRATFSQSVFGFSTSIAMAFGTAVVLFFGVRHVQAEILTLGQLLVILTYVARLYGPLDLLGQQVAMLQQAFASAERTFALLDRHQDVPEKVDAVPLMCAQGEIELREVSFSYDGETQALDNISFHVSPGKKVGLMGKTGAGKTTLINLLMRFYDPQNGRLLLDGVDLKDYKLKDLRNQFSIVLQEPVLLSATIAENISYAQPHASEEEIIQAAKDANAHDFIVKLPQSYETQVGERGMLLSGGERQRISLARAFLKDAPMLILDEPTSSVDVETEKVIMDAMKHLMAGRTTFIIAHRLTTLEDCDMTIKLEAGKLEEVKDVVSA